MIASLRKRLREECEHAYDQIEQEPYHEDVLQLLDCIDKLEVALKDVLTQEYGVRNHWAGYWTECKNDYCGRVFAFGGNWNTMGDTTKPDLCPHCNAEKLLGEYNENT